MQLSKHISYVARPIFITLFDLRAENISKPYIHLKTSSSTMPIRLLLYNCNFEDMITVMSAIENALQIRSCRRTLDKCQSMVLQGKKTKIGWPLETRWVASKRAIYDGKKMAHCN